MRLHLKCPWGCTRVASVLHFLVHLLMRKSAKNNSSNRGPDTALEGRLHGEVNVTFEGAP